jgi:hypothetical protein
MFLIDDLEAKADERSRTGYKVNIEYYIIKGFNIFKKKPEFFIIYAALFALAMPFGGFLLLFPMVAGFLLAAHRLESNNDLYFENFFDGFKDFIQLTLLMIVQSIAIAIGFIALLVPGIYLSVAYIFAPLFIVFGKMGFYEAMETSRRLVHKEWFNIFIFLIVLLLLNLLGLMAFGIGLVFTIPITFCAIYVAFDEITKN